MVTVSDFEGHLRIRDEQLKNPLVAEAIRDSLAAFPEVYQSRAHVRAGSLLVLYLHSTGVRERIMDRITPYLRCDQGEAGDRNGSDRVGYLSVRVRAVTRRRLVHAGLLASLVSSLLGAAFDRKKLHVIAGILFLGVLGFHLSNKKRQLFA